MSVLVDTSVWSLALRRRPGQLDQEERRLVGEWRTLIRDGRVRLAGVVRQELLSGVRDPHAFERLRERLAAFDDVPAVTADYERAATFFNTCRAKGITPSSFDMLICALAAGRELAIFTTDVDFRRYAKVIPVRLHPGPSAR